MVAWEGAPKDLKSNVQGLMSKVGTAGGAGRRENAERGDGRGGQSGNFKPRNTRNMQTLQVFCRRAVNARFTEI